MGGPNGASTAGASVGDPDPDCAAAVPTFAASAYTCVDNDSYPGCSCDITPKDLVSPGDLVFTKTVDSIRGQAQSSGTATDYLKGNGNTVASGGTGCINVNECVDVAKCRYNNEDFNTDLALA